MTHSYTVEGMTCASCAQTIEKAVSQLQVSKVPMSNLATETLFVQWQGSPQAETILQVVEKSGYSATLSLSPEEQFEQDQARKESRLQRLKQRLIWMLVFTVPLFLLTMGPMVGVPVPNIINIQSHPLHNAFLQLAFS